MLILLNLFDPKSAKKSKSENKMTDALWYFISIFFFFFLERFGTISYPFFYKNIQAQHILHFKHIVRISDPDLVHL